MKRKLKPAKELIPEEVFGQLSFFREYFTQKLVIAHDYDTKKIRVEIEGKDYIIDSIDSIHIEECHIQKGIRIEGISIGDVVFVDCDIECNYERKDDFYEDSKGLYESIIIESEINFLGFHFCSGEKLSIEKSKIIDLEFPQESEYKFESVTIYNNEIVNSVRITDGVYESMTISNNKGLDSKVDIQISQINELIIVANRMLVSVRNCFLEDLSIRGQIGHYETVISEPQMPNGVESMRLTIASSDMSGSKFLSFDFRMFNSVLIQQSDISDMKTSEVYFSYENLRSISHFDPDKPHEIYRQFYLLTKKHHLIQESNEYLALVNSTIPVTNWRDRSIKWFNKWTTNYGVSWTRGVLFLSGVLTGIFLLYQGVRAIELCSSGNCDLTWVSFGNEFSKLFILHNPIHSYSEVFHDSPLASLYRFLDLFSRIAVAAVGYQIVQAFRKFGRK